MKKIILVILLAVSATVTNAQKNYPDYDGQFVITGTRQKTDMGVYTTAQNNISAKLNGAWGHLGYDLGYNYKGKFAEAFVGYAIIREDDGFHIVFSFMPGAIIKANQDLKKTKSVFLGAEVSGKVEQEDSYEIEGFLKYNGKLRNNNTQWNESLFSFEVDGTKRIVSVFAIGLRYGYENGMQSEPKPTANYQNPQYVGQVYTNGRTYLGIFPSIQTTSFHFDIGPEISREKFSYKDNYQPKSWNAGDWLLNWRARLIYKFQYFKSNKR